MLSSRLRYCFSHIYRTKRKRFVLAVCILMAVALYRSAYSFLHWYNVQYHTPNIKLSSMPAVIIEPNLLGGRDIFLLVLVTTTPWRSDSLDLRDAIRITWGRSSKVSSLSTSVVIFNMGLTYSPRSVDEEIANEASQHGDILVGDYKDTYGNIIIKVFFAFEWTSKLNCKFVLKADDDVYLRLPRLVEWLQSQQMPERLYAGVLSNDSEVERSPDHRHFVSYKTYNYSHWKTFARGFTYVISVALLPQVREAVQFHQVFPVDDCYFGILMETLQVKPRYLPNCSRRLNNKRRLQDCDDCVYHVSNCIGNPLTFTQMLYVHVRVTAVDAMDKNTVQMYCTGKDLGDPWDLGECKS